jgi:hypothetical protein
MTALECHSQENPVVLGPAKCLKRKYCRKRPIAKKATATSARAYKRRETLSSNDVGGIVSMVGLEWSQRAKNQSWRG